MNNFHEDDYDGVVLKIPSWFIKMNELEKEFETFKVALHSANKSMYYLDHQRNLYELDNFNNKREIVDKKKKEIKENQNKVIKRINSLMNGEFYELEWVNVKCVFDSIVRLIDGEQYEEEYIFTKSGIKASFEKLFREQIKNYDDICQLSKMNYSNVELFVQLENSKSEFIDMNYTLFQSSQGWGRMGISLDRLNVKYDWRKSKNGYKYMSSPLIQLKGGAFGYVTGNREYKLKGFKMSQMMLVK